MCLLFKHEPILLMCLVVSDSLQLWTAARQAPLSTGILQARTQVGDHALLQGIFPTQGSKPVSLMSPPWQVDSLAQVPLGGPNPLNRPQLKCHLLGEEIFAWKLLRKGKLLGFKAKC